MQIEQALADVVGSVDPMAPTLHGALKGASRPVIVIGNIAEAHPQASRIRAAAAALAQATGAAVNRLPLGANAVGLARHGVLPAGLNARAMLEQPREAYVLFGIEPGMDFADNHLAATALSGAKVIAFTAFACTSTRRLADVILPIALLPEIEATLSNLDGIDQRARAGGKSPGESRPGWKVLRALAERMQAPGFDFTDLDGLRAQLAPRPVTCGEGVAAHSEPANGLERIASAAIYRADAVLRRAPALNAHPLTRGAAVALHPEQALALGLSAGAMARVDDGRGTATLPVIVDSAVAKGAAWIESGYAAVAPMAPAGHLTVTRIEA